MQSNLGASIVGGLVVGVLLLFGSRIVNDVPLGELAAFLTIASVLAVALGLIVFSFVNRTWRGRTWGWLAGLRLSTRRQRERAISKASLNGYADGCESTGPEIARLNSLVDSTATERDASKREAASATAELKKLRVTAVLSVLAGPGTPQVPNLPLPRPRWLIYQAANEDDGYDENDYFIRNAVRKSVAKRVRIDARTVDFEFWDGADWDDVSGDNIQTFRGAVQTWAEPRGWDFSITWYDENGTKDQFTVSMPQLRNMTADELGVF